MLNYEREKARQDYQVEGYDANVGVLRLPSCSVCLWICVLNTEEPMSSDGKRGDNTHHIIATFPTPQQLGGGVPPHVCVS